MVHLTTLLATLLDINIFAFGELPCLALRKLDCYSGKVRHMNAWSRMGQCPTKKNNMEADNALSIILGYRVSYFHHYL